MPILPPSGLRQGRQLSQVKVILAIDHHRLEFSELSETNDSENRQTLPTRWTRPEPVTIVLTRAAPPDSDMIVVWSWYRAVSNGEPSARKDCSLELYDGEGRQLVKYLLSDAWPIRIELQGVEAGAPAVPTERVTIQCEAIREAEAI